MCIYTHTHIYSYTHIQTIYINISHNDLDILRESIVFKSNFFWKLNFLIHFSCTNKSKMCLCLSILFSTLGFNFLECIFLESLFTREGGCKLSSPASSPQGRCYNAEESVRQSFLWRPWSLPPSRTRHFPSSRGEASGLGRKE